MKRKRRSQELFGLSFLDCICCGFGSVILLFVLTRQGESEAEIEITTTVKATVQQTVQKAGAAQARLAELLAAVEAAREQLSNTQAESSRVQSEIRRTEAEIARKRQASTTQQQTAARIDAEQAQAQREVEKTRAGTQQTDGSNLREGTERRHYLTGFRVDGRRNVVLLDVSGSTLANTAESLRSYADADRAAILAAPKRVRMLDTLDWLLATMEGEEFQIFLYNDDVRPAVAGTEGQWLSRTDLVRRQAAAAVAWSTVPSGGTNLEKALTAVLQLQPRPENIYLITDSLPNRSALTGAAQVSASERQRHIVAAKRQIIGQRVAVHTILFPFDGDPLAPSEYWDLALKTNGSFFIPAPDWPN